MKNSQIVLVGLILFSSFVFFPQSSFTQNLDKKRKADTETPKGNKAIVVDQKLSVVRSKPSLYALPIKRLSLGRSIEVISEAKGEGVLYFEIALSKGKTGWVQAEAVVGSFRKNDDQRLARLIQSSNGFDQIELAVIFLKQFPKSRMRPAILLLIGDLIEEKTLDLSTKARERLKRGQMAASGAPLHSFYLNYSGLDRYQKLGIRFLFNINTRSFHYDGEFWLEILRNFPNTSFAEEARGRLDTLKSKMNRTR